MTDVLTLGPDDSQIGFFSDPTRPRIVCLCGSTRFKDTFLKEQLRLTLEGIIVLSVGCFMHSDAELGIGATEKVKLDELHLRKIDIADEVLILNVGGYVGSSTAREIVHAGMADKAITFLEPEIDAESSQRIFAARRNMETFT